MTAEPGNQYAGQFPVRAQGTYHIEITSPDGRHYNGSNEYDIDVLEDRPPTVVIEKPGRDLKVSSVQEVFAEVRAEDDYGVASVDLYYSVNGGEERRLPLQELKNGSAQSLTGSHTFFLEELKLKPGDFISYYAKARDNNSVDGPGESTSDIYFMEVRPFDRQFRQAQQQGGGGGGGDDDSNALTRRQREIIAATFRVQREEPRYKQQEKDENYDTVRLSQNRLKTDTDALIVRIKDRLGEQLGNDKNSDYAKLVEYLGQASKEMDSASGELGGRKSKEAMPPEQRALQQLLRAEAVFRDIQVASGAQGQGGGSQNAQELADLFVILDFASRFIR